MLAIYIQINVYSFWEAKMKKYLYLLIICLLTLLTLFTLTGCGRRADLPPPIEPDAADGGFAAQSTLDTPMAEDAQPAESEAATHTAPEVPLYNDYHISLDINPETRMITGVERIRYTNHTGIELDNIVLRTYLNAFSEQSTQTLPYFARFRDRIFRHGMDYGYLDILHVSMDKDELAYEAYDTFLDIRLDTPLEIEETVQIVIQFEAYIPKIGHRTGANDHSMWMGMFLPTLAVHNGLGWDDAPYYPAGDPFLLETAHYTVLVTTPPEYTVAGTGHKKEEVMEDTKLTTFSARLVRDFAFAVSPVYRLAEAVTDTGVDIHFYYYSDGLNVDEIMDIIKRSMEYFDARVGAYPYGQVSVVETDMFTNGMEFAKIVFMDSAYLRQTDNYASLVHEIGHQWFYNVVGNNPITEAWLDEGMTLYVQEAFFHEDDASFHHRLQNEYEAFKRRVEPFIIASDLSAFDNWTDFYLTHYTKAKLMLYALNIEMGDEAFWQLISQYYQAQSFRIAKAADFIALAEEIHGESLQSFFALWLFGEGLPDIGRVE
jgi:predicted small lipoprotein YifL